MTENIFMYLALFREVVLKIASMAVSLTLGVMFLSHDSPWTTHCVCKVKKRRHQRIYLFRMGPLVLRYSHI